MLKIYRFRLGLAAFAFLEVGGGGAFAMRLPASSKERPLILKSNAFGMDPLNHKTPIMTNKIFVKEGLTIFDTSVILSWNRHYQRKEMSGEIIPTPATPATAPTQYPVYYSKSNFHRVIHADGVYGGTTPSLGNLIIHFFSHRLPLPDQAANDTNGNEVVEKRVVKPGVEREVEVSVVMGLDLAKSMRGWLDERIKYLEGITPKAGKK